MPRDIKHREGCDRPTGPVGTEAACDCAMYQGQFPPPDGYEGPVPNERERELARDLCWGDDDSSDGGSKMTRAQHAGRASRGLPCPACDRMARALARHREELLAPVREIRELLDAHDGNRHETRTREALINKTRSECSGR